MDVEKALHSTLSLALIMPISCLSQVSGCGEQRPRRWLLSEVLAKIQPLKQARLMYDVMLLRSSPVRVTKLGV